MTKEPENIELIIGLKYEKQSYVPIQKTLDERVEWRKEMWENQKAYAAQLFQKAKERFAAKYPEMSIIREVAISYALLATGKKKDLENIWGVTFKYETFPVHNINTGSRMESDWTMYGNPAIPKDLEDIVQSVSLNRKVFLTD